MPVAKSAAWYPLSGLQKQCRGSFLVLSLPDWLAFSWANFIAQESPSHSRCLTQIVEVLSPRHDKFTDSLENAAP